MAGKERGYTVIRREKDKEDCFITFAQTASLNHILHSIEADGYAVLSRETVDTPADEDSISTTIVTVQPLTKD